MKFKFTYVRLYVEDWKNCREFYTNVLGLQEVFVSEIDSYAELTDGSVKISLLDRRQLTGHFGTSTGLSFGAQDDSIALSFSVEDVEEAGKYLKSKGAELVSPAWNFADWGIKAILVRDPEGNLIELTELSDMVGADSGGG